MLDSRPDRLLNQLVVAALTIFVLLLLILGALVARQVWLQNHIVELSSDIQGNLDELEEMTEDIQDELSALRATAEPAQAEAEHWENITELLDDVDARLDSVESGIEEVGQVLNAQEEPPNPVEPPTTEPVVMQDSLDQLFTVFAALAGLSGIIIAVFLALALRVQDKNRLSKSPPPSSLEPVKRAT
ncbi:MAG: hypothetical protein WBO46_10535 [Caldilineaceae bacterium]